MAANHNSQGPEGNYDPAGSTQMFRAFVEEAAPAGPGPAVQGSRRRQGSGSGSGSKTGLWLGLGVALLVVVGAVAWLALS
ncbi:hypothetical protein [Streptomyces sp. NPDC057686]|uniref:hypothetical protein n=1 Tax=unclassified Streptomyces TaxID=2593676 RepID=UPI003679A8B2